MSAISTSSTVSEHEISLSFLSHIPENGEKTATQIYQTNPAALDSLRHHFKTHSMPFDERVLLIRKATLNDDKEALRIFLTVLRLPDQNGNPRDATPEERRDFQRAIKLLPNIRLTRRAVS